MISEICANWIFNNIPYLNELDISDIKMRLRDVEDKDIKTIVLNNRKISFPELCRQLSNNTVDAEAKAHLLGFESRDDQSKQLAEVNYLIKRLNELGKGEQNQYVNTKRI